MINVNDRVEFRGRGQIVRGTVTDITTSKPGSRNKLVQAYGLRTPSVRMVHVLPDGAEPTGVWRVPEQMCTVIGKAKAGNDAHAKAREIMGNIKSQRFQRAATGRDAAYEKGLYDLKKGDKIEVQFRGGTWLPVIFSHLSHSGSVGFKQSEHTDRVRFTPSQFVRIPNA